MRLAGRRDFGFDEQGGQWEERPVNALLRGRRRVTKESAAYSEATVQTLRHAKHSNVLCKGWDGRELPRGLSHDGHLKHTDRSDAVCE